MDYMGDGNSKHGKIIIYTRVSTANQKNDLLNQVALLTIREFERHGCWWSPWRYWFRTKLQSQKMEQTYRGVHIRGCKDCSHCTSGQIYKVWVRSVWKVLEVQWGWDHDRKSWKLTPQEELVNDLLSKEIGGIVEKYSVAIKKKTEYTFWIMVSYLQEVSRYDDHVVKELQDRDQPNAGTNWHNK